MTAARARTLNGQPLPTTFRLREDLHKRARMHALRTETSLQALVTQALEGLPEEGWPLN